MLFVSNYVKETIVFTKLQLAMIYHKSLSSLQKQSTKTPHCVPQLSFPAFFSKLTHHILKGQIQELCKVL